MTETSGTSARPRMTSTTCMYMHARFYNPQVELFLSTDPENRYQSMTAPQRWNRYTYTLGNPLKYVDPDGR